MTVNFLTRQEWQQFWWQTNSNWCHSDWISTHNETHNMNVYWWCQCIDVNIVNLVVVSFVCLSLNVKAEHFAQISSWLCTGILSLLSFASKIFSSSLLLFFFLSFRVTQFSMENRKMTKIENVFPCHVIRWMRGILRKFHPLCFCLFLLHTKNISTWRVNFIVSYQSINIKIVPVSQSIIHFHAPLYCSSTGACMHSNYSNVKIPHIVPATHEEITFALKFVRISSDVKQNCNFLCYDDEENARDTNAFSRNELLFSLRCQFFFIVWFFSFSIE